MGFVGNAVSDVTGAVGGLLGDATQPISQGLTVQNGYQATPANISTSNYANAIQQAQASALGGTNQGNATAAQQQQLVQALQNQASGNGPSLAGLQLQQATDQNNQQAAGAVASQKGINPALAAREILQNQASNNQTAANQSAQLKQQEEMNANTELANVLGTERSQDIGQEQANTQLYGTSGQLQNQQNQGVINNQLGAEQINAGVAAQNANNTNETQSGLLSGLGAAGSSALGGSSGSSSAASGLAAAFAKGGKVRHFDDGGGVPGNVNVQVPNYIAPPKQSSGGGGSSIAQLAPLALMLMKAGGKVPGRAPVKGDSAKNDIVPSVLSPGEVVLPRSVTMSKDSGEKAKAFVQALKSEGKRPTAKGGYSKVLETQRNHAERLKHLESLLKGA